MMEKPLISIIVPVYNVEKYLPECIESICAQTYTNLEIILVDDGSTDRCPQICDDYALKDKRIKVIHKANGGLSSARNAGLDHINFEANGYISFVDSDDYIEQDMYEKMVRNILKADADLCMCRSVTANEEGIRSENNVFYGFGDKVISGNQMLELMVKNGAPRYIVVWNKLIKSAVFKHLRFAEGKQHEDEYIVHHLFGLCERIIFMEDILYIYRIRSNSIMHQEFTVKRLDSIDAYIDRVQYFIAKGSDELAALTLVTAVDAMTTAILRLDKNDEAKERVRLQDQKLRQLRRCVSLKALTATDRIKVFLGAHTAPIYRIKLKLIHKQLD